MVSMPLHQRLKIDSMSPPSSMEMMRMWSSSLTQMKNFLLSAQKMPRLLGQSRPAPAAARSAGPVGSWKRLPLPRSSSAMVLDIEVRSVYLPLRSLSLSRPVKQALSLDSTSERSLASVNAGSESPWIERPARMRVDLTYLLIVSTGIVNGLMSAGFMLETWSWVDLKPCHPSTMPS